MALVVPASAATAFPDVKKGSWYEAAVTQMQEAGLIKGLPDGTFGGDKTITAAEFVTIAARCANLKDSVGQCNNWAADTMQAALEAGWYDWDEIPPTGEKFDEPINRELAVKIIMRALLPDVRGDYNTESAKMKDFSELSGRYYESVLAAYASGVINGDGNGNFRPKSGLSRAEACVIFSRALKIAGGGVINTPDTSDTTTSSPITAVSGGVSENGWLQVIGTQLCNEDGEPIVLHGMSSHGMQWYSQFANAYSIGKTGELGANVFRVAMYTGEGGYISDPKGMKSKVIASVDAAIACDMYVIIDWHILSDGNPQTYKSEAKAFFAEMAERYKDSPAVIYEVCNEPNGNVSWEKDIKPYEEELVSTIRAHSPKAIILLGSSTWSQDIDLAAKSPVSGSNLMYTLHFYAGIHGSELRSKIDSALSSGLPIFISEWGTSRADGGGGVYSEETETWLSFLNKRGISWCSWSLCDKNESSAALNPGASPTSWSEADLSASGKIVFSHFKDGTN
jgi:hypothetical protein